MKYSIYELYALVEHINNNNESNDTLYWLKSLYKKLPLKYKHSGIIYRGLRIEDEKDAFKFLNNMRFIPKNRSKFSKLESWSRSPNVGIRFARQADYIGVVLKKSITFNNAVMVFNKEIWEHIKGNVSKGDYQHVMEELSAENSVPLFFNEQEVTLKHNYRAVYNMCEDVIYVTVMDRVFLDDKYSQFFNLFIEDVNNSNEIQNIKGFSLFKCNGEDLTFDYMGTYPKDQIYDYV